MSDLYDTDAVTWAEQQAEQLAARVARAADDADRDRLRAHAVSFSTGQGLARTRAWRKRPTRRRFHDHG